METEIEHRNIYRNYSDLEEDFHIQCYSLAEVLIEKMTALMGRTEPRDLYDFWYLTEIEGTNVDEHIFPFYNKAENKKHDPKLLMEKVLKKETAFRRDWEKKLASQIHDIPKYDEVFRGAKRHLKF